MADNLQEENEKLTAENLQIREQLREAQARADRLDKMLGIYMERLKEADSRVIWYQVETDRLREYVTPKGN